MYRIRRMKHLHKWMAMVIAVVFILCGIVCVSFVYASEAGSNDDPIALKSYVDAKFSALEKKFTGTPETSADAPTGTSTNVNADVADLAKKVDSLTKTVATLKSENETLKRSVQQASGTGTDSVDGIGKGSVGYIFEIHEIKSGQRVLLGASTEMIIRTGSAQAIKGELGGVIDLITGEELDAGDDVTINHLLLSSREDNRGVRFTEDAYVMIKGAFSVR